MPYRMPCGMPLSVMGSWGNILDHDCDGLPLAGSLSIYLRPLPPVIMRSMFGGYTGSK